MSKKAIAQENGDGISPLGIRGWLVAPEFRPVHNVVVHQCGDVDQFHNDRKVDVIR